MPYSSNAELPKAVRQTVPEEKHSQFRQVFNSVYEDTKSEQRAFQAAWSAVGKMEEPVEKGLMDTLRQKAEEYNEKYGEKHGRVTADKLKQVYDRGVGAYKTNPTSVRPNVTSKEQWAHARVNSFLRIARGAKAATHDKDLLPKIKKAQYAADIFTTPQEAVARSMDLGLFGRIHVHEYMGQAVYMPGESHEEYLRSHQTLADGQVEDGEDDYPEDEEDRSEAILEALVTILQEVLKEDVQKAEYQGRQVPLNKPRRIQGGNKKFEVYVKDGDKVKRVTFGDPNMEIRRDDPAARRNFRARHSCDTATDKTSARYWSCRMWEEGATVSEMTKEFEAYGEVTKVDDEQRIVYGYASVVSKNGEMVVDRQGDVITADEMEKAATRFMLGARNGLTMHKGDPTTTIVHSMPLTKQVMDAFGISSDKEGWLIAVKVHDDDTWDRMKKGEFTGFSIGGRARKVQLDD